MVSSVQVAVRVRPPFQTNQIVEDVCVSAIPQTRQIIVGSIACFTVDYAFPSDTTQSNLYDTCLSDLVNYFLQGSDITIIAFGKSNSGKRYSLFGPLSTGTFNDSSHGLILRATQQIFNSIPKIDKRGQYKLLISFLEFTTDGTCDLIAASQNHREFAQSDKVRTAANNFESVHCQNFNKVYNIIKTAIESKLHKNCTTDRQSHVVFIFTLQQDILNLGRIERKEWKAIFTIIGDCDCNSGARHIKSNSNNNCSLRSFSEIIASITSAQDAPEISANLMIGHPFLTNLLKDGLSGRSQTLVLCCVSPSTADYCDTLSQLSIIDKLRLLHMHNHYPGDIQSNADVFGLEFAVSQWERLVSDAEGLFQKLIENDLPKESKMQIEQWLCLKQECSDCLVTDESTTNYEKITRSLERIDEVTEYEELSTEDHSSTTDSESVEEMDSQLESDSVVEDDTATCLNSLSIVDNKIQDFEEKLELFMHKFRDITNEMMDKQFGTKNVTTNSQHTISTENANKSAIQNGITSERRKSLILPEISAPQPNSSNVFQPISDQLFLEDNSKNGQLDKSPINLQNCQYYEKRITDKYRAIAMNYEKRLQDIELIKQLAGHSARKVADMENNLQNSKKRMQKLIKLLKRTEEHKFSLEKTIIEDQKRINELEEKCKLQFSKPKLLETVASAKEDNDVARNESLVNFDDRNSRICDSESLRQEIINLRKTREYLLEQRRNLDTKLNKDKVFTNAEERKFLELDEAIEAIDTVIEYKNEIMCGHNIHLRDHANGEKGEEMLVDRLMNLSEQEMRTLLYKYFWKVIDLRESGRRFEQQLAEQDHQIETQTWKIRALSNAVQQAHIENERRLIMILREHDEKLHLMFRHYGGQVSANVVAGAETSTGGSSMDREMDKVESMESQPLIQLQGALPKTSNSSSKAITIPQQNLKKLQGSLATHTTKVTRKKNKLIIQQQKAKNLP